MNWKRGALLGGKYKLGRKLGAGAAAEAWEAENTLVGRTVAVKILHSNLAKDASTRTRFLAEARAAARIAHPNVVDVFDLGMEVATPFIVMELCDGETLSAILEGRGAMGISYAADLMVQVLAALCAAHEIGIVHRDLKPDNIMVVHPRPHQPMVKVLDFGIAQGVFAESQPEEGGLLFGTPEYMPPEQARGENVDALADIYAAGAILYELLTGSVPFPGDSVSEVLSKVLTAPVPSPARMARGIPVEIEALVRRALDKDPRRRPSSAREFLRQLTPYTSSRRAPSDLPPARESEAPVPLVGGRAGMPPAASPNKKLELVVDTKTPILIPRPGNKKH
jgi:serine/threonine-protein kinase